MYNGSRVVACGLTGGRIAGRTDRRTGRHDDVSSRFSQFCERTKKKATYIQQWVDDTEF